VESDRERDPERRESGQGAGPHQEREPDAPSTDEGSRAGTSDQDRTEISRPTRVILLGTAVVVVLVLVSIAVGSLPLYWARRVSSAVDGARGLGTAAGLVTGFVFTAAPLLVLRQAVQRHRTWKNRGWLMLAAVLVGFPNLLTLGMMLGNYGHAAQAREVVDLGAPGFRGATLVGAVVGAAGVVALWWLWASRVSRGRRIVELEDELRRTAPSTGSGKRRRGMGSR
jgi:hypothetical protein